MVTDRVADEAAEAVPEAAAATAEAKKKEGATDDAKSKLPAKAVLHPSALVVVLKPPPVHVCPVPLCWGGGVVAVILYLVWFL